MARVHPTRRAAGHGAPIDATNTSVLLSWANHTDVEDAQYDENEPTRQIPAAWTFPPGKRNIAMAAAWVSRHRTKTRIR